MLVLNQAGHLDDWQLLNRVASDPQALACLFQRHRHFVFRVAFSQLRQRELAEDVTQEVFYRVAGQHRRFRAKAQFRSWLYRVTINLVREQRRRHRHEIPLEAGPDVAGPTGDQLNPALTDLLRALHNLPQRQREVVLLRFLEGMSTEETAQALGIRPGSVKTHLHRALKTLRQPLSGEPI